MPKLDDGGFGSKFGYQIDKMNETVGFEDSSHTYFDLNDGTKYVSVTTLVKEYTPAFNSTFWASYKALEALADMKDWLSVKKQLLSTKRFDDKLIEKFNINSDEFTAKRDEILESYKKAGEDARTKGTATHLKKELSFYNEKTRNVAKYGIGGKFNCTKGKFVLDDPWGLYPELLISYNYDGLRICGQADCVCKAGNEIYILDWKTSKKIDKTSYFDASTKKNERLKYPLNNLMASNYWEYSLQLSLYMWMLQQQYPEFECKKLAIVQINDEGKETVYDCQYLKNDVERMLNHYKKSQKIKQELDKNKPIKLC